MSTTEFDFEPRYCRECDGATGECLCAECETPISRALAKDGHTCERCDYLTHKL